MKLVDTSSWIEFLQGAEQCGRGSGAGGLTALEPGVIIQAMTTTVTSKGAVVLPRKVLRQQKVRAGDHFEVIADADDPGVILLRRVPNGTRTNWADVLLACPENGWFKPMP